MKYFKTLILIFSIISIFSTTWVFNIKETDYENMWLLPSTFIICFLLFIRKSLNNPNYRITFISVTFLFFLWAVINPLAASMVGSEYIGKRYIYINKNDINYAILVSVLAILGSSIYIRIITTTLTRIPYESKYIPLKLEGSKIFYSLVIFTAFSLLIIFGKNNNLVNFFVTPLQVNVKEETNSFILLARQFITIGATLLFLMTLNYCKNKYDKKNSLNYFIFALISAIILTGMIIGDRRSVQLFTGTVVIFLLVRTFPKYKKITINAIIGVIIFVLLSITLYRIGSASGSTDGYLALSNEFNYSRQTTADYFQVYFGGLDSIATSMQLENYKNLGIENLIFDFSRTIFGISLLIKDYGLLTSEVYNNFLYLGEQNNGQLIFAPSYSFLYFGILGSPLILIINITLALILENLFRKSKTYERKYLYGYCLLRVTFNILVNTPTIITVVTLFLVTFGLVIITGKLLKKIDINKSQKSPNEF